MVSNKKKNCLVTEVAGVGFLFVSSVSVGRFFTVTLKMTSIRNLSNDAAMYKHDKSSLSFLYEARRYSTLIFFFFNYLDQIKNRNGMIQHSVRVTPVNFLRGAGGACNLRIF